MPTRAQRPRLTQSSPGQKAADIAYKAGLTGTPLPQSPIVAVCAVDHCGAPSGRRQRKPPATGMVRVRGSADGAPSHWYCPGRCAAIANARADLRTGGHR
ncbi:hypothetical protein [Streptomyces sp. NBC_00198]|uniref:hypothetical protein n=1 Tax=Streptomyces sp. NBC_00198 TaxID=2975677 RepID=UPI0022542FEC|nr:hypothetical protein [Streptomyces sp. NBC_00198]MCX5285980.1 hypothetical protein [Streptomyces sp. NBC_00198]MCX5286289.1 hypothetical protein [Streptomyces sp. NBC_00198]